MRDDLCSATVLLSTGIMFMLWIGCHVLESPPELSEEDRIDLWIDLHTAQMAAQNFPSDQRDSIEQLYIKDIAAHYRMTPEEVDRFMDDMKDRPKEMLKLYESAMDSVQNLKHEMRTIPDD